MAEVQEPAPDATREDMGIWSRWKAELDFAQKDGTYVQWQERAKAIVDRYRDNRTRASQKLRKFNVLWSNIQTLKPVIYSKAPKPIVERRYMDRDPAGRLASTILERVLSFQIESSKYYDHVSRAVDDFLLPGMGTAWARYDPSFESEEIAEGNDRVEADPKDPNYANTIENEGDGEPYEKLTYETTCVDHVYYKDFLWGAARTWPEVPWVARRVWSTRSEVEEQYGKEKAQKLVLDYTPPKMANTETDDKTVSYFKKAEIWEVWNKADRKVYIIPPGTPGLVLDQRDDPLKLENFWPCPEPLFATQTTDTIVPVPDYYEYQDQAQELDDLTNRIAMITTAIRANGVYDASQKGVERLLQEGVDNKLIPVDNWAAFAEKGGSAGVISLVPMAEIAQVLLWLYEARSNVKADMYEINGISDLVRGQGNPNETATAQRIKGQFASNRLQAKQEQVARFCRDIIRIMAEIIAEIFSDETLLEMSGIGQTNKDEVRRAVQEIPQPAPPEPPQPQEGQPPMDPMQVQMMMQQQAQQAQQQYQQQVQQVTQQKQQEQMALFQEALAILRSDKLRGFRVDIETDSTIQPDAESAKQSATELFSSTLQGLQAAGEVVMQAPELIDPIGQLLMFTYRQFRVGRNMEASLEEALDKLTQRIEQSQGKPPPPSPEEIKAQAEQKKLEMEAQNNQQSHQLDMEAKQADIQLEQQKGAFDLDLERQRMELEGQKMRMELEIEEMRMAQEERKLQMQERAMQLKAATDMAGAQIKVRSAEDMARIKSQNANRNGAQAK